MSHTSSHRWSEGEWAAVEAAAGGMVGMSAGRFVKWAALEAAKARPAAPVEEVSALPSGVSSASAPSEPVAVGLVAAQDVVNAERMAEIVAVELEQGSAETAAPEGVVPPPAPAGVPLWVRVVRVLVAREGQERATQVSRARGLIERGMVRVDGVVVSDPELRLVDWEDRQVSVRS